MAGRWEKSTKEFTRLQSELCKAPSVSFCTHSTCSNDIFKLLYLSPMIAVFAILIATWNKQLKQLPPQARWGGEEKRNDSKGNLKRRWQTLNGDCGRMESSRLRGKGNTVLILAVVLPYPGDLWWDLTPWPLLSTFIKWAGWYPNLHVQMKWGNVCPGSQHCPWAHRKGTILSFLLHAPRPKSTLWNDQKLEQGPEFGFWPQNPTKKN